MYLSRTVFRFSALLSSAEVSTDPASPVTISIGEYYKSPCCLAPHRVVTVQPRLRPPGPAPQPQPGGHQAPHLGLPGGQRGLHLVARLEAAHGLQVSADDRPHGLAAGEPGDGHEEGGGEQHRGAQRGLAGTWGHGERDTVVRSERRGWLLVYQQNCR